MEILTTPFIFVVIVIASSYFVHKNKIKKLRQKLDNLEEGQSAVYLDHDILGYFVNSGRKIYIRKNDYDLMHIGLGDLIAVENGDTIQFVHGTKPISPIYSGLLYGTKPVSPVYSDLAGVYVVKNKADKKNRVILASGYFTLIAGICKWGKFLPVKYEDNNEIILLISIVLLIFYFATSTVDTELHKADDVTKQVHFLGVMDIFQAKF